MAENPSTTDGLDHAPRQHTDAPAVQDTDVSGRVPLRYDELWLSSLFRPLLITLLIGCIDVAFVGFLRHIFAGMPVFHAQLLVLMGIGSALVAGYTTTLLIRPEQRDRRTTGYRLAELGLLLFLARVLMWTFVDGWPAPLDIFYRPVDVLITGSFIAATLLVLLSWGAAAFATGQFLEMALRPDELADRVPDRYRYVYDSRMRSDRRSLLARFTEYWIFGGVFLLMLTAGSQFGPAENGFFALARQGIPSAVIGAGVVYFLTGFILIAIGRLAVLRAQWQIEEVTTTASIARNWPLYALGLIAIMGIVAALLPLGGTFWLARILMTLMQVIYFAFYFLFGLLIALLTAVMPGSQEDAPPPESAPFAPPPVEQPQPPLEVSPWLGGAVFWTILVLLLGYAAYIYLSGKGFNFGWLKRWWQMLRLRWSHLWFAYTEWRVSLRAEEAEGTAEEGRHWLRPFSWLRLRGMTPTQRVRYFYLSMLQQATERGIVRRPGETPLHYAPRLEREIADEEKPVSVLTEQFVQIHYAAGQVEEESVPYLQRIWQRIRKALE